MKRRFKGVRSLDPRLAAIAISFGLGGVVLFATCGGCGRHGANGDPASPSASGAADGGNVVATTSTAVIDSDAAALRDPLLWDHAKNGETEDLMSLATHEGAVGLVEASSVDTLRPTAIRAMGFARGWAQLPYLAKTASGKNDDEAKLALEATIELAARPRKAEDPEDAEELKEGCEGLDKLARDPKGVRTRRVSALRALRMMPCPPPEQPLPTDVDAK